MPTEDEITSLLENIQPTPTSNLRARVAQVTWNALGNAPRPEPRRPAWFARVTFRRTVFSALAVVGVLILFFSIPPFNGIAQRVAFFFNRNDQDTLTISLTPQPPSQQFSLSPSEAATQAGFVIHQPDYVPEGFRFNGVAYDPELQTVSIDFHSPVPGKFLRLTQRQTIDNRISVSNIGASAEIQNVDIHIPSGEIVTGEYVAGAWRIPTMEEHLQTEQPDMTATMQVTWNPNAKIHMLRWETDDILYEIIHADQTLDMLSAEMLVKIAESMK